MTFDEKIRDEKLQYNINEEAAKIIKTDKYEYLTGEEVLPFDQSKMTEEAKISYFSPGNAFKKQIKSTEDQWKRIIWHFTNLSVEEPKPKSNEDIIPKDQQNNEIKKELNHNKTVEEQIHRKRFDLWTKYKFDF